MAIKPKKKTGEQSIMVCPKCKSPDVDMDKSNPVQPALGLPTMYECNKCGYMGYTFPIVPISKISKLQQKGKKKGGIKQSQNKIQKLDTNYGKFEVSIIWKVLAPLILIVGLFFLFKEPSLGIVIFLIGVFMFYMTYFKNRDFKDK